MVRPSGSQNATMAKADTGEAPGLGCSILATVILLFGAFIGYKAVSSALEGRRNDAALDEDGVRVTGIVVDHSSGARGEGDRPTVKYVVAGRAYQVRAQRGLGVKDALARPAGSPMDVVYLRERPNVARIPGYELPAAIWAILTGSLFLVLPLAALAFLIWMGVLFGKHPADAQARLRDSSSSRSGSCCWSRWAHPMRHPVASRAAPNRAEAAVPRGRQRRRAPPSTG